MTSTAVKSVKSLAEHKSGQEAPKLEKDQTVSFIASFDCVREILEKGKAPQRPNRNRPLPKDAAEELEKELEAWDAASDEALVSFENALEE